MKTLRQILLACLFLLIATVAGFLLYPLANRCVRAANDGVAVGEGYYNPYTRFVPRGAEAAVSVALDLALSGLLTTGGFYVVTKRQGNSK